MSAAEQLVPTVSDLHPALVRAFLDRVQAEPGEDADEVLVRCGVLSRGGRPTRFGLLALGIRPERFVPSARERPLKVAAPDGVRGARALLPAFGPEEELTSRQLVERTGLALGTVRRHLIALLERDLVVATAPSTSKRRTYRLVHAG